MNVHLENSNCTCSVVFNGLELHEMNDIPFWLKVTFIAYALVL